MLTDKHKVLILTPIEKEYSDNIYKRLRDNLSQDINIFTSFASESTITSLAIALSVSTVTDIFDTNDSMTIVVGNSDRSVIYDRIYVFHPDVIDRQFELLEYFQPEMDLTDLYTTGDSDYLYNSLDDLIMDLKEEYNV